MLGHLYQKERVCPACGSRNVARSRRRGTFDAILPLIFLLRPYRCRHCHHRFLGYVGSVRAAGSREDIQTA